VLSQWLASPSHPAPTTRQHWLADHLFAMLPDTAVTTVNPGLFADAPYLAAINLVAHLGIMPWIFGDTLAAPPSVNDIGRVAAAALMEPARHAGRTYRPTGPELLSGEDMAAILARVFGRSVRLAPTPVQIFVKAAHLDGHPPILLASMRDYIEELKRGAFALGAPNDHVRLVTGRAAESFEAVARRMAALPENRRSAMNTVREFARFMAVPFVPTSGIARYVRGLRIPAPARPEYTDESTVWQREHGVSRSALPSSLPQPLTESAS
jgi:hypothetical protein